jgi:predicted permease
MLLELDNIKTQMLVLFASLPTASAAYVLAIRMGGDGRIVGITITIATLISAITIPFWLILVT